MVVDARWGKREGKVLHLKMCRRKKITGKTSCIMEWEMRQGKKQQIAAKSGASFLPLLAIGLVPSLSLSQCLHLQRASWNGEVSLTFFLFTAFVVLLPGQHFTSVLETYYPFNSTRRLVWKDLFQMFRIVNAFTL